MKETKVLVPVIKDSGSDFHRLVIPARELDNKTIKIGEEESILKFDIVEKDSITFDQCLDYNIIFYNWDIKFKSWELGWLASKGVKLLYSIDDFWQFSELHPYYNNNIIRDYVERRVKENLTNATAVVTTTKVLATEVSDYNKTIGILPNFIKYDFKGKTISEKLRIGVIGSISHYPDWLQLKQIINRLAKNKNIVNNCEFYICGYTESPSWDEIVGIFKKKKNLKLYIKPALDVDNYMSLYDNIDVCLMPLETTKFNLCKSALKLGECAVTKTLPLGSYLYNTKELSSLVMVETPFEYEKSIEALLDKDYFNKVLEEVTAKNLEVMNYENRMENTRQVFEQLMNNDYSTPMTNTHIWGIKYKEDQITEYTPYFNSTKEKAWRFEYSPMMDILDNKCSEINEEDYIGVFSWKFPQKTGLTKEVLSKILDTLKPDNYDFIGLSRSYWEAAKEYLEFSNSQHPKLEFIMSSLLDRLWVSKNLNLKNYAYSNFFIMKKKHYKDYVDNWVKPALAILEGELWNEVNVDANYPTGLSPEDLKKYTGLDFYNYVSFTIERLIVYFIASKNLKSINVL